MIGSSTIQSFFDRIIILTRITNNRSLSRLCPKDGNTDPHPRHFGPMSGKRFSRRFRPFWTKKKNFLVENFFLGLSHFFDHPGLRRFLLISDLGVFTGVIVDGQASETRSGYRGPKVRAGGEATRSNLEGPRCTLE